MIISPRKANLSRAGQLGGQRAVSWTPEERKQLNTHADSGEGQPEAEEGTKGNTASAANTLSSREWSQLRRPSPNMGTFFHGMYTSLPVSFFTPVLSFSLPHLFLCSFSFALPVPPRLPPPSLPEALSSELPRFFIKELSLKPSNDYGEGENTERRDGGHLRGKAVFHCLPRIARSFTPIPIQILHFSLSPHTGGKTEGLHNSPSLLFVCLCDSLYPSLPLCLLSLSG